MVHSIFGSIQSCQLLKKRFSAILLFFLLMINFHAQILAQDSTKSITIHQEPILKVRPELVYETLLSSRKFSECIKKSFPDFSVLSSRIDSTEGGAFTIFDGHIIGRNIEIVPNQRIVQAWRVVDWPAGIYSIVRFEFKKEGSGTKIIFDQVGFPAGLKEHLSIGWQQHYWGALNKYFQ